MGIKDFFKRMIEGGNPSSDAAPETLPVATEASISLVEDGAALAPNVEVLAAVPIESGGDSKGALLDALIPLVPAGADVAAQYNQAIVKFPKGKGWADLVDRKNFDDLKEGWKMLNVHGEKRGLGEMGAIKQVGLNGPAVANFALQGAAVVVGQAYMNEINGKLDSIEGGIDSILAVLDREHASRVDGAYKSLKRYALRYEEYASDPVKLQAARTEIEGILNDTNVLWSYQLKTMNVLEGDIVGAKKPKENELAGMVNKLHAAEADSANVFQLRACAQQIGMQYDSDFSAERVESERAEADEMLLEYGKARGAAYGALFKKVGKLKGIPLAIADAADDSDYTAKNPVLDAGHAVARQAARIAPPAMLNAAKVKNFAKRNELRNAATRSVDVVDEAAKAQVEGLQRLDLMHNQADAVAIGDGEIRFLKMKGEESSL